METALALLVGFSCVDVVPTVPHTDPVLPGAELKSSSFLLDAYRWWEMGGPVSWSPVLDYPPSSRVTAASSATKNSSRSSLLPCMCRFSAGLWSRLLPGILNCSPCESIPGVTGLGCLELCPLGLERGCRRSYHTGMLLQP